MKATDYLEGLAANFRDFERYGNRPDEPEGKAYMQLSDTVALAIANKLDRIANALRGNSIEIELGE